MLTLRPGLLAVVLLAAGAGCVRQVRPSLGGDRAIDTGVAITVGSEHPDAPELTYDFGDGTPPQKGKLLRHAYAEAGRYRVFALDGEQPVDSVTFTAVSRRITRAMPEKVSGAVYLEKISQNLEALIDFLEKLMGSRGAQSFIEDTPLVELVLELSASQSLRERGIDAEEGMGIFTTEAFKGTVALIGVTDGEKALSSLVNVITREGAPAWSGADGTTRLRVRDGREAAVLLDRGYLYFLLPDVPAPPPEFADAAPEALARDTGVNKTDFAGGLGAIRSAHALGFEGTGVLGDLRARIGGGNLFVYVTTQEQLPAMEQGALVALRMAGARLDLDGFLRSRRPWGVREDGQARLLASMPSGPVAAAAVSVPPQELVKFFFGEPGSEQRVKAEARARAAGLPFEELLAALSGNLSLAAYFDAPAFFRAMATSGQPRPIPKGTVLAEAGLLESAAALRLLDAIVEEERGAIQRTKDDSGAVRYFGQLEGQDVALEVTKESLSVQAGQPISGRERVDLGKLLRERYGPQSFSAGHLSVMVDVARLRSELASVREIPGVPRAKLELFQSFIGAMLDQLPPVDELFLDVAAAEGGALLKGRVGLRQPN